MELKPDTIVKLSTQVIKVAEHTISSLVGWDVLYQGRKYNSYYDGKIIQDENGKYWIKWKDGADSTDLQTQDGLDILFKCWC